MVNQNDEFVKAKTAAFRLLKIRQRSAAELRDRLTRKNFSKAIVDETIAFLLVKKFLDDRALTKAWIRYRQARPYGAGRIRMELRQKGVEEAVIHEELAVAFGEYSEGDVVLELARKRAARYRDVEPVKRKKRVFDFLVRRGFSIDAIIKAVKKL